MIDHADIDSVAARSLVLAAPRAVVNCSRFVTGKYPNQGPVLLLDAGIELFETDQDLIQDLVDGEPVFEKSGTWFRSDGSPISGLHRVDRDCISRRLEDARQNLDVEITRFARNTIEFLERPDERSLLLETPDLPNIQTSMSGRHVLIAVRGPGFERDLKRLLSYVQDRKPVIIAVDGAADALAELGLSVDVLIGDMDSVSDRGLKTAREIVVHAYVSRAGGGIQAPGADRVTSLGLQHHLFPVPGTSEDAAMILAYEKGADLIVAVGSHSNLEDFLDKGRGGMASTFLVRLKVGSRLVDAR
ncbi:MAG: putative cytokinetic ring protein SteA, partial [Armatimonadaceae bacterium]